MNDKVTRDPPLALTGLFCGGFGVSDMREIGFATVTVLAIVYAHLMNGYALCLLWEWFFVPTFHCVSLTIPAAIGIASVFGYLTQKMEKKKTERPFGETLAEGIVAATIQPLAALGFGLLVRCFM